MAGAAKQMSWEDLKAIVAERALERKQAERRLQKTERLIEEPGRQSGGWGDRFGRAGEVSL